MEILRFSAGLAEAIGWRPYEVELASSIKLAEGEGEAHAHVIYFEPGAVIGPHEAGSAQIFLALAAVAGLLAQTTDGLRSRRARRRSLVEARSTRRAARTE